MATRTIANGGGNWNATGTWVEAAVPTASDDVVATATSGQLTINAAAACRSIDLTNYVNTVTHNAFTLTIGTSTANGTKALVFPASGWTYTLSDVILSAISFSSTVASTTLTVDFGSKTTGNVSFSAATTSGHQLVNHGFTCGATATVTLTQGTLDTNGQTCSWGIFNSNNSNTRTLTLGASAITLTYIGTGGTAAWDTTTATGLTFNANTSSITIGAVAGNSGTTATMKAGSLTYNSVTFAVTGANQLSSLTGSSPTIANLTVTGQNTTSAVFSLGTNITVTTSLALNGNSATNNRLLVKSTTIGTQQTITNNSTGTTTFSNLDLQDISGAGTVSWNLAAITGNSGDCLGNSGITFTSPRTLFWVGNSSSWSIANKWSLTSGGTANQSTPLAQDTITFDSHSFSAGSQFVTCDMPRMGKSIDFTNATNNPTLAMSIGSVQVTRLFGSLTLISNMSQTGTAVFQFENRDSSTLTTGGNTFTNGVIINAPGGTITLSGNLNSTVPNGFSLLAGTFTVVSNNVTAVHFNIAGLITSVLNMGSGTWTATSTLFVWNVQNTSGLTINANTSTIVISDTSATSKTFAGGALTYNILTITGDNVTISANNTVATLNVNNAGLPNGLKLPGGSNTLTITNTITTNGSAGNLAILASTTVGSTAILSKASGTVSVDYMSIADSHATGGAAWYAGAHSTNVLTLSGGTVSNNTGWVFAGPPSGFFDFM
jgi:hypothetical protein